jgi:hypothetical protein
MRLLYLFSFVIARFLDLEKRIGMAKPGVPRPEF